MGELLGRLHWRAGYDGRDVEFVMGGVSFSGVAMYIIGFNQMRTWKRNPNEIQQLVEVFYANVPYYPRPNPDDPLYKEFSNGYLNAHPKESRDAIDVGEAFWRASSADLFPRIEFPYHNQVFTKVGIELCACLRRRSWRRIYSTTGCIQTSQNSDSGAWYIHDKEYY
ncbi:hypothetical protein M378DRAFT_907321 [Amanita muscaria Koide BX008]|uniref:DUF3669 domain-containing protein n=1 Tax=Amanita muscaria (strain Koide BX008) TaxID=946122 RepID=A0A0C2SCU1_AMAMK|nr:hypothetical protein M378DRAFT_907321 [Amanita muscaria Koide BX008]